MIINGKIWGSTSQLLQNSEIEIHRISILPNSSCSIHKHTHKWNAFFCISGKLFIEVRKNSYNLTDVTTLVQDGFTTVGPNEFHRFFTKDEPVEALEVYYKEGIDINDIIRENVGTRL